MFLFGVSQTVVLKLMVSAFFGLFVGLAQAAKKSREAETRTARTFLRRFILSFLVASGALAATLIFVVPLIFYLPWLITAAGLFVIN